MKTKLITTILTMLVLFVIPTVAYAQTTRVYKNETNILRIFYCTYFHRLDETCFYDVYQNFPMVPLGAALNDQSTTTALFSIATNIPLNQIQTLVGDTYITMTGDYQNLLQTGLASFVVEAIGTTSNQVSSLTSNPIGYINGLAGGTGLNGANGLNGLTGLDGLAGAIGLQGLNGLAGAAGLNGLDGLIGAVGQVGLTGAMGLNGANGINGLMGAMGLQGLNGLAGAIGLQGLSGLNGLAGTNGLNGLIGAIGLSGANGINGLMGAVGLNGLNGLAGAMGLQGLNGLAGAIGLNGINGLAGAMGLNGVNGLNGLLGAMGLNGLNGLAGAIGLNGINGLLGAAGTNGLNGAAGLNGLNGINGTNGVDALANLPQSGGVGQILIGNGGGFQLGSVVGSPVITVNSSASSINIDCPTCVTNNNVGSVSAGNGIILTGTTAGQLIAGNLTFSVDTNVPTSVVNDTNIQGSIAGNALTLNWAGTLAANRLNSNVVQQVTNDQNVTGSISGQNLTLNWTGLLPINRGGTNSANIPTAGGIAFGNGSAFQFTSTGVQGQFLMSNGINSPTWQIGSLPLAGIVLNSTIRWNGSLWVASSTLLNDDTNITTTDNFTQNGATTFTTGTGVTTFNSASNVLAANNSVIDMTGAGVLGINTVTNMPITTGTGVINLNGNLFANGNTNIGNAATDTLTVAATIQGSAPLTFEGATVDANQTTLAFVDPTADQTITFPNATGVVSLTNSSWQFGGNAPGASTILGTTDNSNINFQAGTGTINVGSAMTLTGTNILTVGGNSFFNGNTIIGNASSDQLTINSTILGGTPLVFDGSTPGGSTTSFAITNPTANNTITFPNASGTVCITNSCGSTANNGLTLTTGNIQLGGSLSQTTNVNTNSQTLAFQTNTAVPADNVGLYFFNGSVGGTRAGQIGINGYNGWLGASYGYAALTVGAGYDGSVSQSAMTVVGSGSNSVPVINLDLYGAPSPNKTALQIMSLGVPATSGSITCNNALVCTWNGNVNLSAGGNTMLISSTGITMSNGASTTTFSATGLNSTVSGTNTIINGGTITSHSITSDLMFCNPLSGALDATKCAGSTLAYSDRRLKENIVDATVGLDLLNTLHVQEYSFKTDPSKQNFEGLIAQDLYKVYPQVVHVGSDAVDANGNLTDPWMIDYGRLTPLIIKSVQDLSAKFDAQLIAMQIDPAKAVSWNTLISRLELAESKVAKLEMQVGDLEATSSSILARLKKQSLADIEATKAATLAKSQDAELNSLKATEATVSGGLMVLGQAYLSKTTVAGDISQDGTFSITDGKSINALPILFLQNSPLSEKIDMFSGALTIEKDGSINSNGKISAKGIKTDILGISSQSLQSVVVKAGSTTAEATANNLNANSRIFTSVAKPVSVGVTKDIPTNKVKFEIANPLTDDLNIDWWMVNNE